MRAVVLALLLSNGIACRSSDDRSREQPPKSALAADRVRIPPGDGLLGFVIGRTEVTVHDYLQCVIAHVCIQPSSDGECTEESSFINIHGAHLPANCVRAEDADRFCKFVGGRLPSKAEWLRAARGDSRNAFPWGNEKPNCDLAVIADERGNGCGTHSAAPVGSRPKGASPFAVLDMVGNVAEFVEDEDPLRHTSNIIVMGGNYWTSPDVLNTVMRDSLTDPAVFADISPQDGFRCAWPDTGVTTTKSP